MARGWFFLSVKWLCAPRRPEAGLVFSLSWFSRWWRGAGFLFRSNGYALRAGQSVGLVFSLSWFSRWWRGAGFFFRSNGLRSARARGRESFFFKLVLALVARGMFYLTVKWLCAPRGPEVGLVFSLSWFSRRWRGAGFFFRSNGLRSARARGRESFFFKLVLALVARGMFYLTVKWLCAPRGPEVGLVFSLSWFSRRWRGAGFFFRSNGLRSARARGREGCFESPLPTSGLHSPRNELRAARP